jgi:beta-N-acetylhexosaminidase
MVLLLTVAVASMPFGGCKQPVSEPVPSPSEMSLDVKIGQMIMVGFRGLDVNEKSPVMRDIVERHIGGVILYDYDVPTNNPVLLYDYDVPTNSPVRNIESAGQLETLTAKLQAASEIPLLIAIDQEGGEVCRLKEDFGFAPTVSARELGRINSPVRTHSEAARIAQTLARVGINLNLAPVVDVDVNRFNPVIGWLDRSFSADPEVVTLHAGEFIRAHRQYGVLCALKHFPGHGSSTRDSHLGFTDISGTWSSKELWPYEMLIREELADVIMTAHVFNANLDAEFPATLSKSIVTDLLRDQLFFYGVVISDDMQMRAIRDHYGFVTALQGAIEAGVDIILISNNSVFEEDAAARAIAIIKNLVDEGKITSQRIDQSYLRIARLKQKLQHRSDR